VAGGELDLAGLEAQIGDDLPGVGRHPNEHEHAAAIRCQDVDACLSAPSPQTPGEEECGLLLDPLTHADGELDITDARPAVVLAKALDGVPGGSDGARKSLFSGHGVLLCSGGRGQVLSWCRLDLVSELAWMRRAQREPRSTNGPQSISINHF